MGASRQIITIKQQVYNILRDDICNGVYAPGQQIQETELSRHLNVSRSPIREALRQLASEGLVVEYPNRGAYVKKYSEKDIEDIYDLRTLLESYAITNSGQHLTPTAAEELNSYVTDFKKYHSENDLRSYLEVDKLLHMSIINLSGNNLVISTYGRITAMVSQFRRFSLHTKQRFDDSVTEHTDIIRNLLLGNYEEASLVNKKHLLLAKNTIIEHFDEIQ